MDQQERITTFQSMCHEEYFKFDGNFSLLCTYYTLSQLQKGKKGGQPSQEKEIKDYQYF